MVTSTVYHRQGGQGFVWPKTYDAFALLQYLEAPEIREAFPKIEDFKSAAEDMILPWDRREVYLFDDYQRIGMIVTFAFTDYHHGRATAASILWVKETYRGRKDVQKLILKELRQAAIDDGSRVFIRTSKLTPLITKQIVRKI